VDLGALAEVLLLLVVRHVDGGCAVERPG
jgi:hypothetical protein